MLREALVEHVPGRQAEPRLEDQDDREREDEEPEQEAGEAGCKAAADARVRLAGYSPKGLNGRALVETSTLFVSR